MLPMFSGLGRWRASKSFAKTGRVALPRGMLSLWPLAAAVAFHLGRELIERPRTRRGAALLWLNTKAAAR